ncbi:MAG: GNAT family N-acetyltransferase [Anaerolineae bacterium]|nr:GNAT family N-acetyltransferase [Anaerolineae bacterium]
MELANNAVAHLSPAELNNGIRVAVRSDASAVTHLLETAVTRHLHADWYMPSDWLGSAGFVILPKPMPSPLSSAFRFVGVREQALACYCAAADVPELAWVRLAALSADLPNPDAVLAEMLRRVEAHLQRRHIAQVAWMPATFWPDTWLEEMGFALHNQMETYVKEETAVPTFPLPSSLTIRPITDNDFETLAELETAAFTPLWRHSAHALRLASHQALSFDVAWMGGTAVGFQLSAHSSTGAHLVRLTIHPSCQGQGVGSALLTHALTRYYRHGLTHVSLNTQVDNLASQHLYRKFWFSRQWTSLADMVKELSHDPI